MYLILNRSIDIVDNQCRPLSTKLTVVQAGAYLKATRQMQSGYLMAEWQVYDGGSPDVPSVEHQIATMLRRLRKIGMYCGRALSLRPIERRGPTCRAYLT